VLTIRRRAPAQGHGVASHGVTGERVAGQGIGTRDFQGAVRAGGDRSRFAAEHQLDPGHGLLLRSADLVLPLDGEAQIGPDVHEVVAIGRRRPLGHAGTPCQELEREPVARGRPFVGHEAGGHERGLGPAPARRYVAGCRLDHRARTRGGPRLSEDLQT
jgi:hypothetical protein